MYFSVIVTRWLKTHYQVCAIGLRLSSEKCGERQDVIVVVFIGAAKYNWYGALATGCHRRCKGRDSSHHILPLHQFAPVHNESRYLIKQYVTIRNNKSPLCFNHVEYGMDYPPPPWMHRDPWSSIYAQHWIAHSVTDEVHTRGMQYNTRSNSQCLLTRRHLCLILLWGNTRFSLSTFQLVVSATVHYICNTTLSNRYGHPYCHTSKSVGNRHCRIARCRLHHNNHYRKLAKEVWASQLQSQTTM